MLTQKDHNALTNALRVNLVASHNSPRSVQTIMAISHNLWRVNQKTFARRQFLIDCGVMVLPKGDTNAPVA